MCQQLYVRMKDPKQEVELMGSVQRCPKILLVPTGSAIAIYYIPHCQTLGCECRMNGIDEIIQLAMWA